MRKANDEQENTTSSSSRNRVVLGDLTNFSNAKSTQNFRIYDTPKPKRPLKRKYEEGTLNSPSTELIRELDFGTQKRKNKLIEKEKSPEPVKEESNESFSTPHKCAFSSSIYHHLHSLEMDDKKRPLPNYIKEVQKDISANMRAILVDWLVEVAEEYKLVSDTLYLAVAYVDRFLSSHVLSRNKLQLLGVCCMLIASKYEEISPPHVEDFCYVTDNTYTKEEVVDMEKKVLRFLNFEMGTPTTKNFLRLFTRATQESCKKPDLQFEFLCCYLAELSLLDYSCLQYLPSLIAASAIFLSKFMIQPEIHPWNTALQCFSGYKPSDLKECVLAIHNLHLNRRGSSLLAIEEKYKKLKFKLVAALGSPSEVPAHYFEDIHE